MKRKYIIRLHLIFWAVSFAVIGLQSIRWIGNEAVISILLDNLIYFASMAMVFYIYYAFITKRYLERRKIVFLIITGFLFIWILTIPITYFYIKIMIKPIFSENYFAFLETNFLFAVLGSLMKIWLIWYEDVIRQRESEKQKISGELSLLRAQINPEFLFGELSNIRAMIETEPDRAIHSIESLSEEMSAMLYGNSQERNRS